MNNKQLKKRFILVLTLHTLLVLALWFGYHNVASNYIRENAEENIKLATDRLLTNISDEFSHMKTVASVISGSEFVQDFLLETNVSKYYEKANTVSEIVAKVVYPITNADSVITITSKGNFYRFSGSLSNGSCQKIYHTLVNLGEVQTVVELDNMLFFCHISPVYTSDKVQQYAGSVVILNELQKTRRILTNSQIKGVDTAVILDGKIQLSSNLELEGLEENVLESLYDTVTVTKLSGTSLSITAAVTKDILRSGEQLFWIISFIIIVLLLIMIAILYRYLKVSMLNPLLKTKDKMQMGLLSNQIDAHFVVNTVIGINVLSLQGENEKAAKVSEGLATILSHQHTGNSLVNIFAEIEILEHYLYIMNIRHGGRYIANFNVDELLSEYRMPGLILQPIIENAINHGFKDKDSDCKLNIEGTISGEYILLKVLDNGIGISEQDLITISNNLSIAHEYEFSEQGLKGVALLNIQKRLKTEFGKKYGIKVESETGCGTTVTILLPKIKDV